MMLRRAAAVVLTLLAVAACDADVSTSITVTGDKTASIEVSATFEGEAAEVLNEDAAVRQGLVDVFENRAGSKPDIDLSSDKVTATVSVEYDQLAALAPITGVSSIAISDGGKKTTVGLVEVTDIKAAISREAAKAQDAEVLKQTLLDVTTVSVSVSYAGGIDNATVATTAAAKPTVSTDDTTATVSRSAGADVAGTFTVTGDPSGTNWVLYGGMGALVAAGAGLAWSRRR
jgi:hypothetical protein